MGAFVAIGDYNGHVGLGVKCSKEVATAIRGAIIMAKLSIVPVRRGFWGTKLLQMAGIEDCYTSAKGSTGTLGNFAKATYAAIAETYSYLTPDLWKETVFTKSPYQEFTDFLAKNHRAAGVQKQEARAY